MQTWTVLGHGELVGRENPSFAVSVLISFTGFMQKISPVALPSGVRDFRMMRRSVVDAILSLTESNRFQRDSLPGWALKPTIWTIQMSKGRLARPVGVLGNSFSTPLKGFLIFRFSLIIAFVAGLLSCFISLLMTFLLWFGLSFWAIQHLVGPL